MENITRPKRTIGRTKLRSADYVKSAKLEFLFILKVKKRLLFEPK